ncbi:MAG: glycosyltransferase [Candidatus Aenigmatarchaeota archaeon]
MIRLLLYFPILYITIFFLILFIENRGTTKEKIDYEEWPSVSIVIPAYNEEEGIADTIEGALDLDYPEDKLEVVVVNDGSQDRTREIAEKYEDEIKLINQENQGKGAALNRGLEETSGEFVACLDADSFPAPGTLKKMLRLMDDDTAAVTPAMKVNKPDNLLQLMQWFEYILGIFLKEMMEKINCIFVTPGPFSLYRRSVLEEVGGFDTDSLVEDKEIAHRFQKHHEKIRNCYEGDVYTNAPSTLKEFYHQRNRWYKGSLFNAIRYKEMVFHREYGDFGMFQMPVSVIQVFLAAIVLVMIGKFTLTPIYELILNLSAVGFQVGPLISTMSFDLNILEILLNLNAKNYMVLGCLGLVTMVLIWISHKITNESIGLKKKMALVPYMFFYFLLIGAVCIVVIWEVITGKEKKW